MSIDLGTETLTLTKQERTWRVECFCEDGTDYHLVAHREIISKDQTGAVVSVERGKQVDRFVSKILADPDAVQLLTLMKNLCDRWAEQDKGV